MGKEFMEDTLVQTRLEIEKLQSEPISDAELSLVKNYLLGQILQSADGPFAMMGLFSSVEINDLDYAFLDTSLQTILTISPEEILETAKQHLDWDQMLIVTAG
jgi:predicted Zn-dependent peptidase